MVGIKDFGMPSVCENCNMCRDGYCTITDEFCSDRENKRADNCPLVPAIPMERIKQLKVEIEQLKLVGYATVDGKRQIASRAISDLLDNMIKEYSK